MNTLQSTTYAIFAAIVSMHVSCSSSEKDRQDAGLVCPENSIEQGGACLFECPHAFQRNTAGYCDPGCLPDWEETQGVCAQPCPSGMEALADGLLCRTAASDVGTRPCLDGDYNSAGSENSEQEIYVNATMGSESGDGSQGAPYQTIQQAVDAIEEAIGEVSIILAQGQYSIDNWTNAEVTLPEKVNLLGVCSEYTNINASPATWVVEQPDSRLDLRRLRIAVRIEIDQVAALEIEDCQVESPITWSDSGGDNSITIARSLFTVPDYSCLAIMDGNPEVEITGSLFETCGSSTSITASQPAEMLIEDNWFYLSESQSAFELHGNGDGEITLTRNWLDGGTHRGIGVAGWQGPIQIDEQSISDNSGTPIWVDGVSDIRINGLRVNSEEINTASGIYINDSSSIQINEAAISRATDSCVHIHGAGEAEIVSSHLQNCGEDAIRVADSDGISIENTIARNSGDGIYISDSVVTVKGTSVGANESVGIRIRGTTNSVIEESTVSGNTSAGIDATSLGQGTVEVKDCDIYDNTGLGILVRSGGEAVMRFLDNRIVGTRPGTVQNAQGQGVVGDGIAVLTGTDGVASRATLQGNTVTGNSRLGILAHGEGTTVQCDDTTFGPGNGYDGYVSELTEGSADLILQAGGQVTGADGALAQQPEKDLFVEANPGGGDPH